MNSFLQLYEEDNERFVERYEEDIRRAVESRIRTVHFISDIVELFFPRLADTATVLLGGDVIDPADPYRTIAEQDNLPSGTPPIPGAENGDEIIR